MRAAILAEYELSPAESVLLDQAAAIVDVLERLNEQIAAESLTASGSTGQTVAAPLLAAQRAHAETLSKLLGAVAIPAADESEGRSSTSKSAQKAALIRWSREKEVG
jgi:hypothetical protein